MHRGCPQRLIGCALSLAGIAARRRDYRSRQARGPDPPAPDLSRGGAARVKTAEAGSNSPRRRSGPRFGLRAFGAPFGVFEERRTGDFAIMPPARVDRRRRPVRRRRLARLRRLRQGRVVSTRVVDGHFRGQWFAQLDVSVWSRGVRARGAFESFGPAGVGAWSGANVASARRVGQSAPAVSSSSPAAISRAAAAWLLWARKGVVGAPIPRWRRRSWSASAPSRST